MKKKLLSALLCLALALTLLPTATLAAPTRLKSVDLVIDLPKAGDPNEMETEVTIKSMKSGNIDLLANGAGILYSEWQGDDVETDDGYAFRAGTTYLVNIKLAFDTTKGYCANYKTVGGENIVGPDTFSATVNGVPATIRTSAQYFPTLQVSLTLEGERYTEQEKEELNADLARKTDLLRQAKRAMATPRTQAVAESKQLENFVNGVTVMTDANHVLECSATSFLRNWDSILEKKRANLRSISEPARLRQPPPRSTGAAHARGRAQSIREERRIAAPPVLFALLWVRLLPALYGPFCGPLRPFGGCPWGVTPPARECLPPAPPDTRRRG